MTNTPQEVAKVWVLGRSPAVWDKTYADDLRLLGYRVEKSVKSPAEVTA